MSGRLANLQFERLEDRSLPSGSACLAPVSQVVSNQILAGFIPVLNSLDDSLASGDHDYDGHRAQAVKDIHLAENELVDALDFVGDGGQAGNTKTTPAATHPPTQQASNALLTGSIPVIEAAIKTLQAADKDYGGHRLAAVQYLIGAETELKEALAYAAAHDHSGGCS